MSLRKISNEEIKKRKPTVAELRLRRRTPICLMLDNIRSRFNVGAIFRTADAALVLEIILGGITPVPPHKEIDKSALGATGVVPWQHKANLVEEILSRKSRGETIVVLEIAEGSVSYCDAKFNFPVCLVLGSEVEGVSQKILDIADVAVQIPMLGLANSLNVATACGIALFEILKQYKSLK